MVLIGKNCFAVSCSCGCDNTMIVKVLDDNVFISFASSEFSNKQFGINSLTYNCKEKLKEIICHLTHKSYCLMEIILKVDEDKNDFIKALKSINVADGAETEDIPAKLFVDTRFAKEDGTFSVILINKTPLNEILKGKTYHSFDIALNKTQWETFVKNVCRKLEKI